MKFIEEAIEYETAITRVLLVVPPAFWEAAREEMERRESLMAQVRTETPSGPSSPRIAAAESVYQDVIHGRLW